MEFERYYLDLFEMLNSSCKKIASGKYEKADAERDANDREPLLAAASPHSDPWRPPACGRDDSSRAVRIAGTRG